jgi:hypothetical protein
MGGRGKWGKRKRRGRGFDSIPNLPRGRFVEINFDSRRGAAAVYFIFGCCSVHASAGKGWRGRGKGVARCKEVQGGAGGGGQGLGRQGAGQGWHIGGWRRSDGDALGRGGAGQA